MRGIARSQGVLRLLASPYAARIAAACGLNRHHTLFHGPYPDWAAASTRSSGYADRGVIERAVVAARATLAGSAAYDRDGVSFPEIEYSWPLAAAVMTVAASRGRVKVVDVGGALGNTLRQLSRLLVLAPVVVDWRVVDLPEVVARGKEEFETPVLSFHATIADATRESEVDVVLLSSSLQYFEKPLDVIREASDSGASYLILDRTPLGDNVGDRVFIQEVARDIAPVSYPLQVLNRECVDSVLRSDWNLIARWESPHQLALPDAVWQGALWERRA